MATKKPEVSFEENIKELEAIVKKLESGDVSLDEMLELFEEGVSRTKACTNQLKTVEQKISVLVKSDNDEMVEEPFETC